MSTRTEFEGPKTAPSTLRRSFAIQRRVIGALFLREVLTRYGRHNIGFLWLFVEPMIFTLSVTALWTALQSLHGSSIPIVAFALTGYSSVLLWRGMPARTMAAIEPNYALMYHRNVKVIDIYAARLLLEAGGVTISFVVLSVVFIGLEWMKPPENVLQVAFAWILLAWFGMALGITLGALAERVHLIEKLWHPFSYILFPLSGAAFIVDALPPQGRDFILLIPMVHATEMLREGYFGSLIHAHYDLGYLVGWSLGLSALGMAAVRIVSRELTPE